MVVPVFFQRRFNLPCLVIRLGGSSLSHWRRFAAANSMRPKNVSSDSIISSAFALAFCSPLIVSHSFQGRMIPAHVILDFALPLAQIIRFPVVDFFNIFFAHAMST